MAKPVGRPDSFQIDNPQDRELPMLIAGAYRNKFIASVMDIAIRTAQQRIYRLCRLAQVSDRFQLALWIVQQKENPVLPGPG